MSAQISQKPQPSSGTATSAPKDRIPTIQPRQRRQQPAKNIAPVPETPSLPLPVADRSSWAYIVPSRRIILPADHSKFLESSTCSLITAWIFGLAESVEGTAASEVKSQRQSNSIGTLLDILDQAQQFVTKCPPNEQGGSRFGNKAFRGFLDLVKESASLWHQQLGIMNENAIEEASVYLQQSFGNRNRIDYGSGHELNFTMWLLCLYQLGIVDKADFKPLVLSVFDKYLSVMRSVQMTYYLEPAGSHGVWGLDDYQFLPFLFGASQLLQHPYITPRAIHQDLIIEEFGKDFLYLGQVGFVNGTKTVKGLRWHSPMLDDISSAKSWTKIEGGMRKMFVAEVLGKLPVMQHFLFGSLIPATENMSEGRGAEEDEDEDQNTGQHGHEPGNDHVHKATGWGDCCGIKVPSSIAAAQESKKMGAGVALRRIPFD